MKFILNSVVSLCRYSVDVIRPSVIRMCKIIEKRKPAIEIRAIEAIVAGTAQIVRNIKILSIELVRISSHLFDSLMSFIICIQKVCQLYCRNALKMYNLELVSDYLLKIAPKILFCLEPVILLKSTVSCAIVFDANHAKVIASTQSGAIPSSELSVTVCVGRSCCKRD